MAEQQKSPRLEHIADLARTVETADDPKAAGEAYDELMKLGEQKVAHTSTAKRSDRKAR
jgi:hypothetical protein